MQNIESITEVIERRYQETSEFLVDNAVEKDPAAYYKAQGLNEIYEKGVFNLEDIRPQYLDKSLKMRVNELKHLVEYSEIQKHQGRIEALKHLVKLIGEA
jgi:YesN/AraC family two-component response regulator